MIAVCGTCHDDCTIGKIDKKSQEIYKARLVRPHEAQEGFHAGSRSNATAAIQFRSADHDFGVTA
ncbi:MAG TPA: hypothetical protein VLJ39_19615, partial [Tepidisphaeraceae bacterium]|nr:hypothetical protein [Tepidisphaeraceae bacterium]